MWKHDPVDARGRQQLCRFTAALYVPFCTVVGRCGATDAK
jgi:hypothetical protein